MLFFFPHSNIVQRCICSHKLEDVVLIEVSEGLLEASLCCLKNVQIFLFSFGPPHLHAVQVAEIGHRIFSSLSLCLPVCHQARWCCPSGGHIASQPLSQGVRHFNTCLTHTPLQHNTESHRCLSAKMMRVIRTHLTIRNTV